MVPARCRRLSPNWKISNSFFLRWKNRRPRPVRARSDQRAHPDRPCSYVIVHAIGVRRDEKHRQSPEATEIFSSSFPVESSHLRSPTGFAGVGQQSWRLPHHFCHTGREVPTVEHCRKLRPSVAGLLTAFGTPRLTLSGSFSVLERREKGEADCGHGNAQCCNHYPEPVTARKLCPTGRLPRSGRVFLAPAPPTIGPYGRLVLARCRTQFTYKAI